MDIETTLKDLERRLSALEQRLGNAGTAAGPRPPQPAASPAAAGVKPATSPAAPLPPRGPRPKPAAAESPAASSFFGIIGISFLVLAAVLFLKLSIDAGWLNPERQILLAGLAGLLFLFLPHFADKLKDDYGALLSSAGVIVLHLTWLAACKVHHLISADSALVLAGAVGVLALLLNLGHGNAVFVLAAIAGTYLSAPLIGIGSFSSFAGFLLIWNLSFSALAFATKRRDVLLVAAYFAVLTVAALAFLQSDPAEKGSYLSVQVIQFAIFALANLAFSLFHRQYLTLDQAWALCPLLLVFYASVDGLLQSLYPGVGPFFGIALGVLVLSLYVVARRGSKEELPSQASLTTFASLVLVHSLYFRLTPDDFKPLLSLVVGVVAVAGLLGGRMGRAAKGPLAVAGLCVLYGALLTFDTRIAPGLGLAYHFAYGVAALLLVAVLARGARAATESPGFLLLGFGHIQMLYGFYALSVAFGFGSLFVSLAWGAYALLILLWASAEKSRAIGQSAVVILVAVSLKACLYDLMNTGSLVRVLSLLATGLLLYGCGWIFRRMQTWK